MRPLVGTCQGCRREHPLDDGRHVAAHLRGVRVRDTGNQDLRCDGSGKLSREAQAAQAAKSRERAMARLDRLRADAAVAHDAVATGYPWPAHQLEQLRKAALQEYRIKFPGERPRRQRLWFVADRRKTRRSRWGPALGDVYCTLCRELLASGLAIGSDHTERTREHTTLCALQRLAGLAEYVSPPALRMPAEALADRAEVG